MADEDAPQANGHEENGHVPEIELIIKVRKIYDHRFMFHLGLRFKDEVHLTRINTCIIQNVSQLPIV